jgi:murein DD-endopeptidase MepM/ murein hydrolase activator NlpD
MANDLPDNAFNTPAPFDVEAHIRNPEQEMMKHSGNHLLIDHGSNEYSLLAHMQQGSVQAKLGDRVAKEQQVGRVGTSGDSYFPHTHYQVQNGMGLLKSEGLPSKFESFDLLMGSKSRRIENMCPNTGMIIRC